MTTRNSNTSNMMPGLNLKKQRRNLLLSLTTDFWNFKQRKFNWSTKTKGGERKSTRPGRDGSKIRKGWRKSSPRSWLSYSNSTILTTMSIRGNQRSWMFRRGTWKKDLGTLRLTMNKKDKEICKISRPSWVNQNCKSNTLKIRRKIGKLS